VRWLLQTTDIIIIIIMFTRQISNALGSDPYVSPHFGGVFPCDKLPDAVPRFPYCAVANTEPAGEAGEHWVAYYFDEHGNGEYFDSYGCPPINSDLLAFLIMNGYTYRCNSVQLQGFGSSVCGQYCIAYLARRCRGESMHEIVRDYMGGGGDGSRGPGENDSAVAKIVNEAYGIERQQQQGSGNGIGDDDGCFGDQSCCARIACKLHRQLRQCCEERLHIGRRRAVVNGRRTRGGRRRGSRRRV